MAFSSGGGSGPMADINVTPLVDVMLVLLIIFMITAPMLSHKIKIDLPQPVPPPPVPPPPPPEPIHLSVRATGQLFWNDEPLTEEALRAQLSVIGVKPQDQQPEIDISAEKTTKYQLVATVMADAKNAGIIKIGFVSGGQ
ncbi:MAG TPA: biopolymer transporter ExbD [Rudaea sp.]|nr:biopolymer transporter ExbD [Rudaea sp.]